jgi:CHAT domain-containing protein
VAAGLPVVEAVRAALAQRALGRSRQALTIIDRAVQVSHRADDRLGEALALRHRARILRDLGPARAKDARRDLEAARALLGPDGPVDERISIELALAALVGAAGDPWRALELYAGARDAALARNFWSHVAQASLGMAVAAQSAGDLEGALLFCRQAVEASDRTNALGTQRQARLYLATALVLAGRPAEARDLAERLRPAFADKPLALRQLAVAVGLSALMLERPQDALVAADQTLSGTAAADSPDLLDELHFIRARALIATAAWAPALAAAEAGRRVAHAPSGATMADGLRGRALLGAGKTRESIEAFEAWNASTESLRRRGTTAGVSMVHFYHSERLMALQTLLELYVQTRRWPEAFATIQRMKARWFSESVAMDHAGDQGLLDGDIQARRRLFEGLSRRDAAPPPTITDVQAVLDPHTVLLDYAYTQDALVVFAVRHDAFEVRRFDRARPIVEAAADTLLSRMASDRALDPESAAALARFALEPLAAAAPSNPPQTLVLIPTGGLADVPWAALPDTHGRPLVASFDIVRAPSTATWLELGKRRPITVPAAERVLAIADTAGDLPAARAEALALQLYYPLVDVLAGPDGTRDRIAQLAPEAAMIELAVHASAGDSPRGTHLRLGGDAKTGEGAWRPREIAALSLAGPLVTLFACHSSAGPRSTAEEAATLDRAFLLAGASGVVSSLWPISDVNAAIFSSAFHERLSTGETPAHALAEAQRAMLRSTTPTSHSAWRGLHSTSRGEAESDVRAWAGYVLTAGPQ